MKDSGGVYRRGRDLIFTEARDAGVAAGMARLDEHERHVYGVAYERGFDAAWAEFATRFDQIRQNKPKPSPCVQDLRKSATR